MQPSSAEPREEPSENAPLNRPGAARGELSALRHKQAPRTRGARACVICNKRKIKCNLSENATQCDNCRTFEYECIPHERKRKRYTVVQCETPSGGNRDPPRARAIAVEGEPAASQSSGPEPRPEHPRYRGSTPRETTEFVQAALVAQFGRQSPHGVPSVSPGQTLTPRSCTQASPTSAGFLGRSKYLGGELLSQEDSVPDEDVQLPHSSLSADDMKVLEIRRAFDLPPRAACESLISTFVAKCDPWMPIVPRKTLTALQNGRTSETPILLLQALLMAGSRMQTERSPLQNASTQALYDRAKVLFFIGYEKDPMTLVTAVTILQYWNPSGPGHISIHNSSYWLRVGVGLVHQMGLHKEPDHRIPGWQLRRRVFWTLFSRDCLLSMGQGRPRTIHLEDCSIGWPSVSDFLTPDKRAHLFVAHVCISGILGDLTQWYLRGGSDSTEKRLEFERRIKGWIEKLPPEIRILDDHGSPRSYDCDTRFLLLPYFTAISILHKPRLPSKSLGRSQPTIASTIASSCTARIFEDALARGEVRNGVAMQAIYLLIAGICQLSNYDYPLLWQVSTVELNIIKLSLAELSKTWQTAKETLRVLQRLQDTISTFRPCANPPPLLPEGLDWGLFEHFGSDFCPKLQIIADNWATNPTYRDTSGGEAAGPTGDSIPKDDGRSASQAEAPLSGAHSDVLQWGSFEDVGTSPQSLMANLLHDLSAGTLYDGEDWFLQDL